MKKSKYILLKNIRKLLSIPIKTIGFVIITNALPRNLKISGNFSLKHPLIPSQNCKFVVVNN